MTDDQPQLPDSPDALTPELAREAPAGPETDRLCLQVMGWSVEQTTNAAGEPTGYVWRHDDRDPHFPATDTVPRVLRISRTSSGAYRAREWLREHAPGKVDPLTGMVSLMYEQEIDEHLATARLLLLLYAEGVLSLPSSTTPRPSPRPAFASPSFASGAARKLNTCAMPL
ncbi:MAG: hypothetical protein ABEN55_13475 [Bradymonadaceae bacterium]